MNDQDFNKILHFWFEEIEPKQWFVKDDEFDARLKRDFTTEVSAAMDGNLNHWRETPRGNLALILLLDQMPRNIYRATPMSFGGDARALELSLAGHARGDADGFNQFEAQFLLMPMMHSEDLDVQEQSLPLFKKHCAEMTYDYAVRHRDIIARFGRFPHRNAILGRESSAEEIAFLQEPNSSF